MQRLIEEVAALFGLTRDDLTGASRRRHIVEARQAAAWVLRHAYAAASLEVIGQALGGRDHTTIIYSIARTEERLRADPELAAELRALVADPLPMARHRPRTDAAMRWWANAGRERYLVSAA